MPMAKCHKIQHDLLPNAAQIKQLLNGSTLHTLYKDRVVAHDLLEELIDTARYASDREQ